MRMGETGLLVTPPTPATPLPGWVVVAIGLLKVPAPGAAPALFLQPPDLPPAALAAACLPAL